MYISETIRPLQDQTALVFDATTNIGKTIAKALAMAGAKVMINYLDDRDQAEQLAEQIRNNEGQAMLFRSDITQRNQLNSMFDVLMAYWGRLDIVIYQVEIDKTINLNLIMKFIQHFEANCDLLKPDVINTPPSKDIGKIICTISNPDINVQDDLHKLITILLAKFSEQNIQIKSILSANSNKPEDIVWLMTEHTTLNDNEMAWTGYSLLTSNPN